MTSMANKSLLRPEAVGFRTLMFYIRGIGEQLCMENSLVSTVKDLEDSIRPP